MYVYKDFFTQLMKEADYDSYYEVARAAGMTTWSVTSIASGRIKRPQATSYERLGKAFNMKPALLRKRFREEQRRLKIIE